MSEKNTPGCDALLRLAIRSQSGSSKIIMREDGSDDKPEWKSWTTVVGLATAMLKQELLALPGREGFWLGLLV